MRNNRNSKYSMNRSDKSYEKPKNNYQKNSKKKNESKNIFLFNNNNNNYTAYQSINKNKINSNKKNDINNRINIINNNKKLNLLKIQNNPMNNNNRIPKNKILKYQNSSIRRDCHTPDRNFKNSLKYNIALTTQKKENKNNISFSKSNMKRNTSFIEYHYKNSSKKFLTRSKSKNNNYNNLSNDRKKPSTPDKINKTRNIKISNPINLNKYGENKRIKEPNNYFNFSQNPSLINLSKSFKSKNNLNNSNSMDSYGSFGIFNKIPEKRNTPDKYVKNMQNNRFYSKIYKQTKLPVLTNISRDKLSKSFSSQYNSKNRELQKYKNDSYLSTNIKLNKAKKNFNKVYFHNYNSKAVPRAKSTDINFNKKLNSSNKLFFKYNNHINQNSKNQNLNNNLISNISYENLNKKYNKTNDNITNSNLLNTNNYNNTFNYSHNIGNINLTQINNKPRKYDSSMNNNNFAIKNGINKLDYNKKIINPSGFLEMAQQKINNSKLSNHKNYKIGNNFITKSSTNTNDEVNSSNSIISKNNQILDSIEEIHFNFVNVVQSSRNLMKIQENSQIDKIINNNSNSTVIIVEERDID